MTERVRACARGVESAREGRGWEGQTGSAGGEREGEGERARKVSIQIHTSTFSTETLTHVQQRHSLNDFILSLPVTPSQE